MNEIQDVVLTLLPSRRKNTPSGWISVNAVCCHNNGEKKDTRSRGGLMVTNDGGFIWHCFNCGFKAGWLPGKLLSQNTRKLFQWMGLGESDIGKLSLVALKMQDTQTVLKKEIKFDLEDRELPPDCLPIDQWITLGAQDPALLDVIQYLVDVRKVDWHSYPWHWSPEPGWRDRVVIPFYHNSRLVGYTARKITDGKPKYLTDTQPGYVFNMDRQTAGREYVILVEGQFDAIAIDGCAVGHNEPNETQAAKINTLGREVIVVPDRDRPGAKLLKSAIDNRWSASLPPWEDDIKDVADAVKRYGKLYTLSTILHYRVQGEINLHLLTRKLENI